MGQCGVDTLEHRKGVQPGESHDAGAGCQAECDGGLLVDGWNVVR